MKSTTFILALAAGASSTILPRDAATTLADIASIDTNTKALSSAVNASPFDLGAVVSTESALEAAVKKGTSDAKGAAFSDADTVKILGAVKSLIPDIVDSLNAAVFSDNLKPVASIVQTNLASLASESSDFSDAVSAGVPSSAKDAADAAKACIGAAFASAAATKSASAACTANIVIPAGGSSSPTTSSSGSSATGSVSASASETNVATSSSGESSATEAPTTSATGPVYPSGASTTAAGGTASPSGTYVAPPPFTGAASSVKVGMSGLFFAALALIL